MATGPTFQPQGADSARADGDPSGLDMLDVVAGLDRQMNQLAALRAHALVLARKEYLDRAAPKNPGASLADESSRGLSRVGDALLAGRSFRAEVATLLNISERSAENLIEASEILVTRLPETVAALGDGRISWRHATIMVDETSCMNPKDSASLEHRVLSRERPLTPPQFARAIRKAREEQNPETIAARHVKARLDRGVAIDDGRDGLSTIFVTLPTVHAHATFNRLTAAAHACADPLDERTLDQRRADIFMHVMLAEVDGEIFGVVPDEWDDASFVHWFRGISAEVTVSVPVLTLLGESDVPATLDGQVPIDPITARILTSDAPGFYRVLTHPQTGVVLSVGRKRYKVPAALRRYLRIRDLTCRFPGCSIAAHRCDIDHTVDWQYDGETNHNNLAHLCRGHHTLKGNTDWTVIQSTDGSGILTWTSPTGRTYRTFPHNPIAA